MAPANQHGAGKAFPVIILTGLSGAGKSTALKVFEDLGFICVDGLPPDLIPELVDLFGRQKEMHHKGLTLGMDVRQSDFLARWEAAWNDLEGLGVSPRIVFIEAKADVLRRRYAATRRPHPLEGGETGLEKALEREREMLRLLRDKAELVLDTSDYSIHDLRRALQEKWRFIRDVRQELKIYLFSFGFKYGLPTDPDLVFDLRFLPNPYFDERLRPLSGRDPAVADFIFGREQGREFLDKQLDYLHYVLPLYAGEGRYRLTVAFGCTGGRHRSVAVAEAVYASLAEAGFAVSLEHRHMEWG